MKLLNAVDDVFDQILQLISNVYQNMRPDEKSDTQLIFIDTAKKIDLPFAYTKNFMIGIIVILVFAGMLIPMLISCCCICANCCGMRSGKKNVIISNAGSQRKQRPKTAASQYFDSQAA